MSVVRIPLNVRQVRHLRALHDRIAEFLEGVAASVELPEGYEVKGVDENHLLIEVPHAGD